HVAAVWSERHELIRVLEAEMPRARRTHRHAAEHDPVAVDVVATASVFDYFKHVRLAGPAVTILHAAKRMQLDERLVWRRSVRVIPLVEPGNEPQLAHADRP